MLNKMLCEIHRGKKTIHNKHIAYLMLYMWHCCYFSLHSVVKIERMFECIIRQMTIKYNKNTKHTISVGNSEILFV